MWNILILTVMVSLTGYYMTANKNGPAVAVMPMAAPYAESMALYRQAVINWFTQNPGVTNASVSMATLSASPAWPSWLTFANSPSAGLWQNYRAPDGRIFIYASPLPPVNILPDLLEISQNSAFVGVYRAGDTTLFSLSNGSTPVPIPTGAITIPAGSPIWVAAIN